MTRKRDRDDTPIPAPDAPADASERAHAEGFRELIDNLIDGAPQPPAMDSQDRALLETATMVVAGTRGVELEEERASAIVDQALEHAVVGRRGAAQTLSPDIQPDSEHRGGRESSLERLLPWTVAAVAAAAAIFLFVARPPAEEQATATPVETVRPAQSLPLELRSRKSDNLVGIIEPTRVGDASDRLDMLFADRMSGYRALQFRTKLGGESQ